MVYLVKNVPYPLVKNVPYPLVKNVPYPSQVQGNSARRLRRSPIRRFGFSTTLPTSSN